jgi:hypothetical protein
MTQPLNVSAPPTPDNKSDVVGNNAFFQNMNAGQVVSSQLLLYQTSTQTPVSTLFGGIGVPVNTLGANGDYYFRQDTPATANQRMYVKSAGAWIGIV